MCTSVKKHPKKVEGFWRSYWMSFHSPPGLGAHTCSPPHLPLTPHYSARDNVLLKNAMNTVSFFEPLWIHTSRFFLNLAVHISISLPPIFC